MYHLYFSVCAIEKYICISLKFDRNCILCESVKKEWWVRKTQILTNLKATNCCKRNSPTAFKFIGSLHWIITSFVLKMHVGITMPRRLDRWSIVCRFLSEVLYYAWRRTFRPIRTLRHRNLEKQVALLKTACISYFNDIKTFWTYLETHLRKSQDTSDQKVGEKPEILI